MRTGGTSAVATPVRAGITTATRTATSCSASMTAMTTDGVAGLHPAFRGSTGDERAARQRIRNEGGSSTGARPEAPGGSASGGTAQRGGRRGGRRVTRLRRGTSRPPPGNDRNRRGAPPGSDRPPGDRCRRRNARCGSRNRAMRRRSSASERSSRPCPSSKENAWAYVVGAPKWSEAQMCVAISTAASIASCSAWRTAYWRSRFVRNSGSEMRENPRRSDT